MSLKIWNFEETLRIYLLVSMQNLESVACIDRQNHHIKWKYAGKVQRVTPVVANCNLQG